MAIWFEVPKWRDIIQPVEMSRVTDQCVYVGKTRYLKHSEYCHYFPTEQEAAAFLRNRLEKKVRELRAAEQTLENLYQKYGR